MTVIHASDCAVNNAPALPVGPCDCQAADVKKRTFEDPPLLNRSASNELLSCKAIAEMFRADAEKIHENWKAIEAHLRVAELRKSCGVEPEKTSTVNIRRPPRYQALPPVPKCKHEGCPNFVESSEEYCSDHL